MASRLLFLFTELAICDESSNRVCNVPSAASLQFAPYISLAE